MAITLVTGLYPPIIDTYMPAFIYNKECKVYFSLSAYNSISDIEKNIQVTVVNQKTNRTALSSEKYPSAIKVTQLQGDEENGYYITINPEDLKLGYFEINQFYRVQIRFTKKDVPDPGPDPISASWFSGNLEQFSEWSTVCLIKGIEEPHILLNIEEQQGTEIFTINNPTLIIYGKMIYEAEDSIEKETLQSYQMTVLDNYDREVVKTDIIYSDKNGDPNEIYYTFEHYFTPGDYSLIFNYTTINKYQGTERKEFIVEYEEGKTSLKLKVYKNNENGFFKVVAYREDSTFELPIEIRRASSNTNFTVWETIKTFDNIKNKDMVFFNDTTIEGGVWYKYYAQYKRNDNVLAQPTEQTPAEMAMFDDIILTSDKKQLIIKYNPTLNSFKRNVLESSVNTIGGVYPVITRNAKTNYRQTSLSGMIFSGMDENGLFVTKEELFSDEVNELYKNYNLENNVLNTQDYVYERFFRDKVLEFLYNEKPKLYRSITEGNILVKLMNVNLTPQTNLGRLVYTFTADVIEVDEASLKNLKYYNIYNYDDKEDDAEYKVDFISGRWSNMIHLDDETFDIGGSYHA